MVPAEDDSSGLQPPPTEAAQLRPVVPGRVDFVGLVTGTTQRVLALLRPLLVEDFDPKVDEGLVEALGALADLIDHIEDVELEASRQADDGRGEELRMLQEHAEDAVLDLRELQGGLTRRRRKVARASALEFVRYVRGSGVGRVDP